MATDQAISDTTTNRQARAGLGVAATYLRRGFEIAQGLTGMADVRKNAMDLLNASNKYAVKIYKQIPDNDEVLTAPLRKQVLLAIKQAAQNLKLVTTAENNLRGDFLRDVLEAMGAAVTAIAKAAVEAAGGGFSGALIAGGIVLVVVGGVVLLKK